MIDEKYNIEINQIIPSPYNCNSLYTRNLENVAIFGACMGNWK